MKFNGLTLLLLVVVHANIALISIDCFKFEWSKALDIFKGGQKEVDPSDEAGQQENDESPVIEQVPERKLRYAFDPAPVIASDTGGTNRQAEQIADSSSVRDANLFRGRLSDRASRFRTRGGADRRNGDSNGDDDDDKESSDSNSSDGDSDSSSHSNSHRPENKRRRKVARRRDKGLSMATLSSHGKKLTKYVGKMYKKTTKGLYEGALEPLSEKIMSVAEKVQAKIGIDLRGKTLALIDSVKKQAVDVRVDFGQVSFFWAPIMERALNYTGDKNLDKLKIDKSDPLDLQADALYSMAFGYEFMVMLIVWRENMLIGHQAFLAWLEQANDSDEFDDPAEYMSHIHAYFMMSSWEFINKTLVEPQTKIEYLIEEVERSGKDFESDFIRDFTVLMEIYYPTIEEFDRMKTEVDTIVGESGLTIEDLGPADNFLRQYRVEQVELLESDGDVDWTVPKRLDDFMQSLKPELKENKLIYDDKFFLYLNELLSDPDSLQL